MSTLKVNTLKRYTGTTITIGESGDTITITAGASLTGPIAAAGLTGALPAISGASLTSLNATNLGSGTVPTARLGTGTASSTTYLAGDQTYKALSEYSDVGIKNDISVLALHSSTENNQSAYNLPNAFVDHFEDDSGIGTETDVDRNAAGEYISTIAYANHTNTVISGSVTRSSNHKFGGYSGYINANTADYITIPSTSGYEYFTDTGDWTVEFWARAGGSGWQNWVQLFNETEAILIGYYKHASYGWTLDLNNSAAPYITGGNSGSSDVSGSWHHIAATRYGNVFTLWYDGASADTNTASTTLSATNGSVTWGKAGSGWTSNPDGYIDELRVSNTARYTGAFTPPTTAFTTDANTKLLLHFDDVGMNDSSNSVSTANATGTLIGIASTASAPQTEVSGVALYKDAYGTAILGTDLKIYLTCDGGSNWTEAVSYGTVTPTFSSGIKMVRLGLTTCTSGTDVRYKVVWANQVASSKETQLHGISVNY
jgi:hypothetical protein